MVTTGDHVCTFLGCVMPVILRETPDKFLEVVGECFVHGLMDGESILGPLPQSWAVQTRRNQSGINEPWYRNTDTDTLTQDDPRLEKLPPEWEKIAKERTPDDPLLFAPHRNKLNGEEINSDPRLSPKALTARGIKLQSFRLV